MSADFLGDDDASSVLVLMRAILRNSPAILVSLTHANSVFTLFTVREGLFYLSSLCNPEMDYSRYAQNV